MAKTENVRREAGDRRPEGEGRSTDDAGCETQDAVQAASRDRRAAVQEALAKAHEDCPVPCEPRVTGHESRGKSRCCRDCVYACAVACRRLAEGLGDCEPVLVCGNRAETPGVLGEVEPGAVCGNFQKRREPPVRLPPPEPTEPGVCYIALTKGKFAIVDAEDYERVSKYKWCASGSGERAYACRQSGGKTISMHRFLMDPPEGMVVDHIDHCRLNNRRSNLRVCTQQQNLYNSRPKGKSSRFKGPCWDKSRKQWLVIIRVPGRGNVQVGRFDDEVEAARAYDRAAHEVQGPYAYLNFPEDFLRPEPKAKPGDGEQKAAEQTPQFICPVWGGHRLTRHGLRSRLQRSLTSQ